MRVAVALLVVILIACFIAPLAQADSLGNARLNEEEKLLREKLREVEIALNQVRVGQATPAATQPVGEQVERTRLLAEMRASYQRNLVDVDERRRTMVASDLRRTFAGTLDLYLQPNDASTGAPFVVSGVTFAGDVEVTGRTMLLFVTTADKQTWTIDPARLIAAHGKVDPSSKR